MVALVSLCRLVRDCRSCTGGRGPWREAGLRRQQHYPASYRQAGALFFGYPTSRYIGHRSPALECGASLE